MSGECLPRPAPLRWGESPDGKPGGGSDIPVHSLLQSGLFTPLRQPQPLWALRMVQQEMQGDYPQKLN